VRSTSKSTQSCLHVISEGDDDTDVALAPGRQSDRCRQFGFGTHDRARLPRAATAWSSLPLTGRGVALEKSGLPGAERSGVLMRHLKITLAIIAIALGATLSLCLTGQARAAAVQLITPEEAAMQLYQGMTLKTRGAGGPAIIIVRPDQGDGRTVPTLAKPVHITVRFEPRGNAKIDMSTLRVVYLKLFGIDITDRLRRYVIGDGFDVPEADIPAGDHSIRVDIKDVSGQASSQVFRFIIK
jgi:hypothetical protein